MQAHAPGRVELLGNHTDYNEGVVLSAAINYAVTAEGKARDEPSIALCSDFYPETTTVSPDRLVPASGPAAWTNYPLGVVDCLLKAGYRIGGFEARFSSDLPVGAGLSSSAAMEVASAAEALRTGGHLWLTANRHLPYEAAIKPLFRRVTTVTEAGGFKVIEAQK